MVIKGSSWVMFAVRVLYPGEWSMVVCIVGYSSSGGISQLFHFFSGVLLFVFLFRVPLAGCGGFGPVGHWSGERARRPGFLLRQGLLALLLSHPCLSGLAMAFAFSWCGVGRCRRMPTVVTFFFYWFFFLCGHVGPPGGKSAVCKFSGLSYLIFLGFSACGFKGVECTKSNPGILFRQLSLAFLCLWCIFFKIA